MLEVRKPDQDNDVWFDDMQAILMMEHVSEKETYLV